jgi:hypothetical protein
MAMSSVSAPLTRRMPSACVARFSCQRVCVERCIFSQILPHLNSFLCYRSVLQVITIYKFTHLRALYTVLHVFVFYSKHSCSAASGCRSISRTGTGHAREYPTPWLGTTIMVLKAIEHIMCRSCSRTLMDVAAARLRHEKITSTKPCQKLHALVVHLHTAM